MKKHLHVVRSAAPGSIAEELNIEPGDILLEISGQQVEDVFDYRFLTADEELTLLIRKKDGEEWLLEIEKDADEELGLEFENSFMDGYRSCSNKCIFCFIDQMPPGMRPTLYFKDDDSRLSFLQGNYVTLTNMSDHDIDRIIRYRMEPINISFHTTDPALRRMMLHNRKAGDIFPKVRRLADAGIAMNGQIVLCRGINDGAQLDRTIRDLTGYMPALQSVSVVPVGLTKFREGLYPLEPFTAADAAEVLGIIRGWQEKLVRETGSHFIHASDEWYLLAGQPLPPESDYDGYPQLENGVGMLRLLEEEIRTFAEESKGDGRVREVSLATGMLAGPELRRMLAPLLQKYPGVRARIYPVRNDFFGHRITVSGLITGQDLIAQLSGQALGSGLILPCNMLRSGENVFLDDITVEEAEKALGVPVSVTDPDGASLCRCILGDETDHLHKRRQMYEQTDRGSGRQTECR